MGQTRAGSEGLREAEQEQCQLVDGPPTTFISPLWAQPVRTIAALGACPASSREGDDVVNLTAVTLGLALAITSGAAFAQGTAGGAAGGTAGTSAGTSTTSPGTTTGTGTGTITNTPGGVNGGMNTAINPSGNTLLPGGQSPAQPAPPAGSTSTGR